MHIESQDQVLKILNDITPAEAIQLQFSVRQRYGDRVLATKQAEAESVRRKEVCDENDAVRRFITSQVSEKTAQLTELTATLRTELYALKESFALGEQSARIRALRDQVAHLNTELDYLVSVKRGADEIHFLDAVEIFALATTMECHDAAFLSHIEIVATLGAAYEQAGSLGVLDARTMRFQAAAQLADKRYESARDAAREARQKYDRQLTARASHGLLLSANVSHAIGH